MTHTINLSQRLQKVASFLPKHANFADIGSDHAYLPCFQCLRDPSARAIAIEVNEGPFYSAVETVKKYELENKIEVRLADGLNGIAPGEITEVVIAGMGGSLIKRILAHGEDKLQRVQRIVTQPNVDEKSVRSWMVNHGYSITKECIVEENEHIYEIIVGDKIDEPRSLSPKQLFFGPFLIQERNNIFIKKWQMERDKRKKVIEQLQRAKSEQSEKLMQFQEELTWIEEVLHNDEAND